MSGKGQSNLQLALENWKKNQAKNQALSVKLADEKAKVYLACLLKQHVNTLKLMAE